MAKLVWGETGERFFETGVDRGVFYPQSGPGLSWNGLVGVTETPDGGEVSSYYLDGIKFLDVADSEDFSGTIEAFSAPREFSSYDGMSNVGAILFIGQQPRKTFGMSYRTLLGNDTQGSSHKYKLHLVYNLLVSPTEKKYETVGENTNPITNNWAFKTTPVPVPNHKPSGHMSIEASNDEFIAALEAIIYGTNETIPRLPLPSEVIALLASMS